MAEPVGLTFLRRFYYPLLAVDLSALCFLAAMSASPRQPSSIFSLDALFENPLFAGGIGLAGLGAAAALGRRGAVRAAHLVKRRLLVSLEINKQDQSYPWILEWLTLPRDSPGYLASKLTRVHQLSINTTTPSTSNAPAGAVRFQLQPGYGRHIIKHKNAYIAVNRERQSTANLQTGEPFETVTLTTLYAHRFIFEDIFTEAHNISAKAHEGKTTMFITKSMNWEPLGVPRKKRPLNSVVLDEGIKEKIVGDVKDFLGRQQWYVDRGIPYRRGYLLYGPPGSGKSSFIQALAGELNYSVAIINLSERGMSDDKLAHLMNKLPPRSLLLLEDCDAAFVNRRQVDPDGYGGGHVTFSGLLNALDGVAAGEERISFLTTNHIDRLDAAVIRPGRVDMTVRIGEASRYQAAEMWNRFYNDVDADGAGRERFLSKLQSLGLISDAAGATHGVKVRTSTAHIQGLFLWNKDNMEGAIDMAGELIPKIYEPEPPDSTTKIQTSQ
jgi:chaperone BCS1